MRNNFDDKEKNEGVTYIAIIFALIIPMIILASKANGEWIGFWGSYLGGIIGASVVYFVAKFQIKETFYNQKKNDEKNRNEVFRMEHEKELANKLINCMIGINECMLNKKTRIKRMKKVIKNGNIDTCEDFFKKNTNDESIDFDGYIDKLKNISMFDDFTLKIWGIDRLLADYFHCVAISNIKFLEFEIRMRRRMRIDYDYEITSKNCEIYNAQEFYNYNNIINEYCDFIKTKYRRYLKLNNSLLRQLQIIIFRGIYNGKELYLLEILGEQDMKEYSKTKGLAKD